MDNMPNTALTSPVVTAAKTKMFNITFIAGLLHENISQWAAWKENTCFTPAADPSYKVRVEGGNMDAIIYVLMHKATHIVGIETEIIPHLTERDAIVESTPYTKNIWCKINRPAEAYMIRCWNRPASVAKSQYRLIWPRKFMKSWRKRPFHLYMQ